MPPIAPALNDADGDEVGVLAEMPPFAPARNGADGDEVGVIAEMPPAELPPPTAPSVPLPVAIVVEEGVWDGVLMLAAGVGLTLAVAVVDGEMHETAKSPPVRKGIDEFTVTTAPVPPGIFLSA